MNALTRSAALLIIGDEILSGKVEDINSRFLCRELFLLGWRVCKVRCCLSRPVHVHKAQGWLTGCRP